jgi:hypothetical protein
VIEFGDLPAIDGDFIREFEMRAFERQVRFPRHFKVDAQLLGFGFERGRFSLYLVEFGAQRLV